MKYHNHILQTGSRHYEEELQNTNSHKTPEKQIKENNHLSIPHWSVCKTRKDTKYCIAKKEQMQNHANNESNNKTKWISKNKTTALEWTVAA